MKRSVLSISLVALLTLGYFVSNKLSAQTGEKPPNVANIPTEVLEPLSKLKYMKGNLKEGFVILQDTGGKQFTLTLTAGLQVFPFVDGVLITHNEVANKPFNHLGMTPAADFLLGHYNSTTEGTDNHFGIDRLGNVMVGKDLAPNPETSSRVLVIENGTAPTASVAHAVQLYVEEDGANFPPRLKVRISKNDGSSIERFISLQATAPEL